MYSESETQCKNELSTVSQRHSVRVKDSESETQCKI